jgi:hypothetical protein
MAKTVRYFENNNDEMYSEGPYVLCAHSMSPGLYRIEMRGPDCPIIADDFAGAALRFAGLDWGWNTFEVLAPVVDKLNSERR